MNMRDEFVASVADGVRQYFKGGSVEIKTALVTLTSINSCTVAQRAVHFCHTTIYFCQQASRDSYASRGWIYIVIVIVKCY